MPLYPMGDHDEPDGDEPDVSEGPCLYLTREQLDRAKVKGEMPKPGTPMLVIGIGKVKRRSESEESDGDMLAIDIEDLHLSEENPDSVRADIEKAMNKDG